MRPLTIPVAPLLASLAAVLSAAPPQGAHEHTSHELAADDRGVLRVIAQAPVEARAWHNPYEDDPNALLAGKKLFLQHCAECHGENARGLGNAVNLHSPGVQNAAAGELVWFLRNGNLAAGMPSWSRMPVERRWQIVTYLKSLRR